MNQRYLPVASRAGHRCEYCLAPEELFNFHLEVDHVIPSSRGGTDDEGNLALACTSCNLFKSDHVTAFDEATQNTVNLFHPREERWDDHFQVEVETGFIKGLTPTGRATVDCLRMNSSAQVRARLQWMRFGLFP
jgi:hypothetical protein